MVQNIKVDVIYFMTATDFEFEFNLGSCCHMRLLNDKTNDKKGFVNSLARAVSRSQIIIACGPLFGEDGLISVTAAAINHGLVKADNKAYGIVSEEAVEIIEGAIPLVTGEGYFGGCIIESGKQSIILLSENRTIRKSIMKKLIHPYIEDMSIMQSAQQVNLKKADAAVDTVPESIPEQPETETPAPETATQPAETETPEPEAEALPAEIEEPVETAETEDEEPAEAEEPEISPNAAAEQSAKTDDNDEHNIDFDFSTGENEKPQEEILTEPETEPEAEETEISDLDQEIETDEDDIIGEGFVQDDGYDEKPGKKINISILIILAVLILAVLALGYFAVLLPMQNGMTTGEYFKQLFDSFSSTGSV